MKYWLLGLLLLSGSLAHAQAIPMPRQKAIYVGWHQCFERADPTAPTVTGQAWPTAFKLPNISVERTLRRWGSFQVGLGASLFSHPRNPDYRKFNTQVFGELRYYLLLRRGRPSSGIYIGLYADMDRSRWIYRAENKVAIRKSFENAGPSIGYQHAIGRHFRFNEGVTAVMQSTIREIHFDRTGRELVTARTVDLWYSYYWYFKLGYLF